MYTLTLVFNKDADKVLMCWHNKQNNHNFIGGKVNEGEDPMDASYRELFEETGISKDNIKLSLVRHEIITSKDPTYVTDNWNMYITTGILQNQVELHREANELLWIDIKDKDFFINAYGNGNCFTFLLEAKHVLGI